MAIFAAVGATEQTALEQVGATGGGGAATIIPNGGTLNGTYQGNVLCEGDVTMTGSVTVEGDLLVLGTFTNNGGYNLTVRGDFNARLVDFTNADPAGTTGALTVDGDFWFYILGYIQTGGIHSQLRVGGNLIGSSGFSGSPIFAYGVDGTNGADIIVYGDLTATVVNISGGLSTPSANAGNGGNLTVYGDANISDAIGANGGDSSNAGYNAGNGGNLTIYGDLTVVNVLFAHGGQGDEASGGNGGSLEVYGNFTTDEVEMYGGNCNSDSNLYQSGLGGHITIDGDFVCRGFCNLSGGDRFGTLTLTNFLPSPDAGSLYVRGNVSMQGDLSMNGGDINTNLNIGNAGNGGTLSIRGSGVFGDDLRAYGGYNQSGSGGNGGGIDSVEGNLHVDDELEIYGGTGILGSGGNGGNVYVRGSAELGYVDLSGGTGYAGDGGYAGQLDVIANLTLDDYLSLSGGSCDSTNEAYVARGGNDLYVGGNATITGSVYATGGSRNGATTVSNTGASPANGGNLYLDGDAVFNYIDLSGGDVATNYPHAPGGGGGYLVLDGSFVGTGDIYLDGGDGVGNNGGVGGSVFAQGPFSLPNNDFYSNGGSANNSVIGGDATTNGSGAGDFYLRAGGVLRYLSILDGSGPGAAPSAGVNITLAHFCTFGTMQLTDRSGVVIRAAQQVGDNVPCTLRIQSMPTKQTLNNANLSATGNISASLDDSLFISDASGWYAVAGTSI